MLGGLSVSRVYKDNLQIETLSASGIGGYSVGYTHDAAGRLWTVTENTSIATYGYVPDSMLVQQVGFTHSSTPRLTTTRGYDVLNRLESISSTGSGTLMPLRYAYRYNSANQRDRVTMGDSTYWDYTYDDLGQVTSGKRKWQVDNTAVAGQQYEYTFDEIGNRTQTKAGGDASGGNLRPAGYTPNRLNQYDSRTVPGAVDVVGLGKPDVSVTVNYNKAARKAEYFHYALPVGNSGNPVYASVTVQNDGVSTSGNIFVPKATEDFGYDLDGNLTRDGRWDYTWDAENRLVRMVVNTGIGPQRRIDFGYDYQGRRITKTNWNNTAGSGIPSLNVKFLYDGWNLLAELNATNNNVIRSFVWGTDLSGPAGAGQGAGGVGGLLKVTYTGAATTNCFVAFDGNGNVGGLIDAVNGNSLAQYEYGPFGEVIRPPAPWPRLIPSGSRPNTRMMRATCFTTDTGITTRARGGG